MPFSSIEDALEDIRQGKIVIVVDDEERENEGDFTMAAEKVTPEAINFMAAHGRGLICLPMTGERLDELRLPLMVGDNTSKFGTAFTVSIEAREGVTTGISAADRATTILTAIQPRTRPADLARPGHVFPLRARPGGVLERAGQTEAAVDLARLAGLYPAGVICEVMNADGTMARVPELREVSRRHGLKIVTVADLIAFRVKNETLVRRVAEGDLESAYGNFRVIAFENSLDGECHLALVKGTIRSDEVILARVQTESTLADIFQLGNDGGRLRTALECIERAGCGVLVYLRHAGREDGLIEEIRSLVPGAHTGAAPAEPRRPNGEDLRTNGIGAQILRQLGVRRLRLLTSHPKKIVGLQGYGLSVVEQVPLAAEPERVATLRWSSTGS